MHSGRAILIVLFRLDSLKASGPWPSRNVVFGYFLIFSRSNSYTLSNMVPTFSVESMSSSVRYYHQPCQTSTSVTISRHYHWFTGTLFSSVSDPKWGELISLSLSLFPFCDHILPRGDTGSSVVYVSQSPTWNDLSSFFLGRRLVFFKTPLGLVQSTFGPTTDEDWQITMLNSRPWKPKYKESQILLV